MDYFLAGYVELVSGRIRCNAPRSPQVVVEAGETRIRYNFTKSQNELTRMETDTISPYGGNVRTHVGGLMKGEVSVSQNIRFYHETYAHVRAGCLYLDTIKVDIVTKPTIYIARNHREGTCMHKSIMEHEKLHVAVDQQLVAKYKTLLKDALEEGVRKIGASHGPFPISKLQTQQENLQLYLQDIVKKYSDALTKERKERQQAVDNLEEYERVQNRCGGRT